MRRRSRSANILPAATVALLLAALPVPAQIEVLPRATPHAVFGGRVTELEIFLRNAGDQPLETDIHQRLFQLSSTTTMPAGDAQPWKRLTILAGQTVVEKFRLSLPEVRAETRFEVRLSSKPEIAIGRVSLTAYPTNLLKQLASLAGEKPIGIFDPGRELKSILTALKIEVLDLEQVGFDKFTGTLAIVGPVPADYPSPRDLKKRVTRLVGKGTSVVFISEEANPVSVVQPGVVLMHHGCAARLVLARPAAVTGLKNDPTAQLNLLKFARMATTPNLLQTELEP